MDTLNILKQDAKERIESEIPNQVKLALVMMLAAGSADDIYSDDTSCVLAALIFYLLSEDRQKQLAEYRNYIGTNLRSSATTDDFIINTELISLSAKMKDNNVQTDTAVLDMLTFYTTNWKKLYKSTYSYRNLKCIVEHSRQNKVGLNHQIFKTAVMNVLLSF